jgi:hypothetical protein
MKNYRKIWENHYGEIPVDNLGRSYEIHHIDGNRENNNISNLKAVSLQEHYDIHKSQGDWAACKLIAERLNLSLEKILEINKKMSGEGNPMWNKRGEESPHWGKKRPDQSNSMKQWWKNNSKYDRGDQWRNNISKSKLKMVTCKNQNGDILYVTKDEYDSNPDLVGITANMKINKSSRSVICIEENEIFKSVTEASNYYEISRSLIYKSIRLNVKVGDNKLGLSGKLSFSYMH